MRMPGAFHVEVIADKHAVNVYLLDMHFENPQVTGSSVSVTLRREGAELVLECQVAGDQRMFSCWLPADEKLEAGTLLVKASRGGVAAEPAHYELPLKWGDAGSE